MSSYYRPSHSGGRFSEKRLRALDVILRGGHRLHPPGYSRCSAGACSQRYLRTASGFACLQAADRHRRVLGDGLGPALGGRQRLALRTTSLTKPSSRPSKALTWRAVRIMPIARFSPICRGSQCTPPASAARPTRGSGRATVTFVEATIRSQASAISSFAAHRDAVDGGDDRLLSRLQSNRLVRPGAKPPYVPAALCRRRPAISGVAGAGAPCPPAPVTIADPYCSGSAEKSSNTLLSSKCASICSAL